MALKQKITIIAIVFISCIVACAPQSFAAWWDKNSLPVPANTQETGNQKRQISGSDFEFFHYESSLPADQIKDFYRRSFSSSGWKEQNLSGYAPQLNAAGANMGQDALSILSQNLIFEKGGEMIVVTFIPAQNSSDNKVRFSVTKGSINMNRTELTPQDGIPVLMAKPKKDVYPVYPKASLINLDEKATYVRATYFTRDDLDAVINFYKQAMSDYGWQLTREKAPEELSSGSAGSGQEIASCPTCQSHSTEALKSMHQVFAELTFSNVRGDACSLGFTRITTDNAQVAQYVNMTNIMVNYEEAKR